MHIAIILRDSGHVSCRHCDLWRIRGRKIKIVRVEGVKNGSKDARIKKFNNDMTQFFCHPLFSLKLVYSFTGTLNNSHETAELLSLPTQIRFPIGGERVTCPRWSKLTNFLGKQQIVIRSCSLKLRQICVPFGVKQTIFRSFVFYF